MSSGGAPTPLASMFMMMKISTHIKILACSRVVLVEHLGGLFFNGRHSCAGDSFAGHSGLYRSESFMVSILVCV